MARDTNEILGRDTEIERLRAFLDQAVAGFAALALKGPPGIGKTVLWRAGTAMALDRGCTVLSAQPGWAEVPLLFSGLTDLFRQVPGPVLGTLVPVQRRALEVALLRTDPGGASTDPRTLSSAVLSVLQQLSLCQPVLVAIDDVQWLDRPSAGCLGFALRRLGASPVGFLASGRTGSGPLPVFDALASEPTEELTVGPLPAGAVEEMLVRRMAGSLQRRVIVKVAGQSGGNPFYALEIAREVGRMGAEALSGRLPLPGGLRDLLKARLGGLPARHARPCSPPRASITHVPSWLTPRL